MGPGVVSHQILPSLPVDLSLYIVDARINRLSQVVDDSISILLNVNHHDLLVGELELAMIR